MGSSDPRDICRVKWQQVERRRMMQLRGCPWKWAIKVWQQGGSSSEGVEQILKWKTTKWATVQRYINTEREQNNMLIRVTTCDVYQAIIMMEISSQVGSLASLSTSWVGSLICLRAWSYSCPWFLHRYLPTFYQGYLCRLLFLVENVASHRHSLSQKRNQALP